MLPRAIERVTGKLIYTTYFGFPVIGGINGVSGFYHLRNVFRLLKYGTILSPVSKIAIR